MLNQDNLEGLCRRRLKSLVLKRRLKANQKSRQAKQMLGVEVRNEALRLERLTSTILYGCKPGLETFEAKQDQWDKSVHGELLAMAQEQGIPIHVNGKQDEHKINLRHAKKVGYEQKFLYDSEDLLMAIAAISRTIQVPEMDHVQALIKDQWSYCPLGLKTVSKEDLRAKFEEMHPRFPHVGVESAESVFVKEHEQLGSKLLKLGSIHMIERYIRRGCTAALRPKLYKLLLQDNNSRVPVIKPGVVQPEDKKPSQKPPLNPKVKSSSSSGAATSKESKLKRELEEQTQRVYHSTVVDRLHALDLELIRNNDNYFVFEDLLRNILPALFRQHMTWLKTHSRVVSRREHIRAVPFFGFALQVAPLAYVFNKKEDIIMTLREMFARYWCQLNIVRNNPCEEASLSLISNLCAQFETMMTKDCPKALHHMLKLGVAPLEIAFPWIHLAFANALSVEELLLLWDRIIGFDSLLILPVLAVAVFKYREHAILNCDTKRKLQDLMKETNTLKVIPLLQAYLFLE